MFLGRFKGVSTKLQWCFEEVSRAFQVTRKIEGYFEGVLRVFRGSFKEVSRVLKEYKV